MVTSGRWVSLLASWRAYVAVPLPARMWTALMVALATGIPVLLSEGSPSARDLGLTGMLIGLAGLSAELGRRAEGGSLILRQRPHKALSAWPFAAAFVLPPILLVPVVIAAYGWTRARGIQVPLWKWVGSGAILVLAGCAVSVLPGGTSPGRVAAGAAVFLLTEALLLAGCALLNDAQDEAWLRGQLRSPAFYVTELSVLASGAVVLLLWLSSPAFMLLAVPLLVALQRSVLVETLRTEAETDGKTGLLHLAAWRVLVERELGRDRPVAVLLADLDHFKVINDTLGHLVGDEVLGTVSARLVEGLRGRDVAGRFGGEEFCVFLPDTDAVQALHVAERLRLAVGGLPVCGAVVRLSVGVATGRGVSVDELLGTADRALYTAKRAGRDRCVVESVPVSVPAPRDGSALPDVRDPGHAMQREGPVLGAQVVPGGDEASADAARLHHA